MNQGPGAQTKERSPGFPAMYRGHLPPPRRPWLRGPLPLGLGLGLSSVLFVAALGLRGPVLLGALVPPVAAGGLWRHRQRRLTDAAIASGNLLDPWILQRRLAAVLARPPHDPAARAWCPDIGDQLEVIRYHAASCAELDPASAVPLLLLLEGWLERIQQVAGPPPAAPRGPLTSPPPPWGEAELAQHLALCRRQLARVQGDALLGAHRQPGTPPPPPPLPPPVQP